jgi:hypothetical protein
MPMSADLIAIERKADVVRLAVNNNHAPERTWGGRNGNPPAGEKTSPAKAARVLCPIYTHWSKFNLIQFLGSNRIMHVVAIGYRARPPGIARKSSV